MATVYKHGLYAEIEASGLTSSGISLGTIPAYIGTMPAQRINANGVADFKYADYINQPILLSSYKDVEAMGLYSEDWETYTLSEAIHAHFMAGNVVAPIILVNVLDPNDVSTDTVTKTVVLSAEGTTKVGYIEDALANIDEMAITIADTELAEGDVVYSYVGDLVKITVKKEITQTSAEVTYKQIAFTKDKVTADKMVAALNGLDMSELLTGYIPNIIAAPYFSSVPTLHTKMVQCAINKISDKWNLIIASDIPCGEDVNTIEKAKAWKLENEYNSKFDKVCYPKVVKDAKTYHLSTLAAYTMQATDSDNDDVPNISPSNKLINANGVVLEDGSAFFMKESEANELNKAGITTVNIIQRQLRLWGSHMANYSFDKLASINFEDRSDSDIRMALYLANMLQHDYIDNIDIPFSRKDIDSVKTSVQQRMNALINENKLLYANVMFNEVSNSEEEMANGNFVFDIEYTTAPNSKSITFKLRYTDAGLALLTAGGEE